MSKNFNGVTRLNSSVVTDGQMLTENKDLRTLGLGCYENAYEGLRNCLFIGFGGAIIPNFLLAPDVA